MADGVGCMVCGSRFMITQDVLSFRSVGSGWVVRRGPGSQVKNNCFTEMRGSCKEGLYLRRIDFVCRPTIGLRVRKREQERHQVSRESS